MVFQNDPPELMQFDEEDPSGTMGYKEEGTIGIGPVREVIKPVIIQVAIEILKNHFYELEELIIN